MKRDVGLHIGMALLAVLWLLPLYFMGVFASVSDGEIFTIPLRWWPGRELGANVAALQAGTGFLRALLNSFAVAVIFTALGLLVTSMAGYAFARYDFRGRDLLFGVVVATLTVPYFAVVIPQFILVAAHLGMTNTYAAVVLPPLASSLGVFFMRQNFLSMPQALIEAARIDGAGEFRIFFHIALPVVRPALAALAIILFLSAWNDYLWPLLVLNERDMYTAPVALGTLIGLTRVSWSGIMAGALLMTMPLLVLFLCLQRYFLDGITAGAVKD